MKLKTAFPAEEIVQLPVLLFFVIFFLSRCCSSSCVHFRPLPACTHFRRVCLLSSVFTTMSQYWQGINRWVSLNQQQVGRASSSFMRPLDKQSIVSIRSIKNSPIHQFTKQLAHSMSPFQTWSWIDQSLGSLWHLAFISHISESMETWWATWHLMDCRFDQFRLEIRPLKVQTRDLKCQISDSTTSDSALKNSIDFHSFHSWFSS